MQNSSQYFYHNLRVDPIPLSNLYFHLKSGTTLSNKNISTILFALFKAILS